MEEKLGKTCHSKFFPQVPVGTLQISGSVVMYKLKKFTIISLRKQAQNKYVF